MAIFKIKVLLISILVFFSSLFMWGKDTTIVITGSSYGDANLILKKFNVINKNNSNNDIYIFDTGDFLGRDNLAAFSNGELPVSLLNRFKYAGANIGNHEFDYGLDILKQRVEQCDFPILSGNIKIDGINLSPYTIIESNGLKVGVFGLSEFGKKIMYNVDEENILKSGKRIVEELKKLGADFIICLGDIKTENAAKLLLETKEIDSIFIGSSNKLANYLTIDNRGIYFCHENDILTLKLSNNENAKKPKFIVEREIIDIKKDITGKNNIILEAINEVEEWVQKYDTEKNIEIGKSDAKFTISELIVKIMRERTKSELSFINSGSVKNDLLSLNITEKEIFEKLKYNNKIYKIILSGSQIENILKLNDKNSGNRKNIYFSGVYKIKGKYYINGRRINTRENYTVAVNDFLYFGGDDYVEFTKGKKIKIFEDIYIRDEIIKYIRVKKSLSEKSVKKVKPTLYWKYYIDGKVSFDGNFNINNSIYPSVLGTTDPFFSLLLSGKFYNEWKNQWHLLSADIAISMGFIWNTESAVVQSPEFKGNNLQANIFYEFNFDYCSPYFNFNANNLIYDFKLNDSANDKVNIEKIALNPEAGVRHHFRINQYVPNIFVGESLYLNISPGKSIEPVNFGFKLNAFVPIVYKNIISFTNELKAYIYILPQFNFALEYISKIKINIFKILYVDFSGTFYFDTKNLQPAASFIIGTGVSIFYGRVPK